MQRDSMTADLSPETLLRIVRSFGGIAVYHTPYLARFQAFSVSSGGRSFCLIGVGIPGEGSLASDPVPAGATPLHASSSRTDATKTSLSVRGWQRSPG